MAKIARVYKRPADLEPNFSYSCWNADVRQFKIKPGSVDAIITSPPYMDALDYARDNRLRLWFLGVEDYKHFDNEFKSLHNFSQLITDFLVNASTWLHTGGYCVCVVGEVSRKNKSIHIANMIAQIATERIGAFKVETLHVDEIPSVRRARKGSYVKTESIIALVKKEH